jgi:hypothetical protein
MYWPEPSQPRTRPIVRFLSISGLTYMKAPILSGETTCQSMCPPLRVAITRYSQLRTVSSDACLHHCGGISISLEGAGLSERHLRPIHMSLALASGCIEAAAVPSVHDTFGCSLTSSKWPQPGRPLWSRFQNRLATRYTKTLSSEEDGRECSDSRGPPTSLGFFKRSWRQWHRFPW